MDCKIEEVKLTKISNGYLVSYGGPFCEETQFAFSTLGEAKKKIDDIIQ